MRYAVEAKPSQMKRLHPSFACNGYIVAGSAFLHVFAGEGETFEVTTNKNKNAFMRLRQTEHTIAGLEPRESRSTGWFVQNGVWQYS